MSTVPLDQQESHHFRPEQNVSLDNCPLLLLAAVVVEADTICEALPLRLQYLCRKLVL